MAKRILASVVVLALAGAAAAFAQSTSATASSGGEKTIEQLYLTNTAVQVLRDEALSTDRDSQLLALSSIRAMIDEGKLPGNAAVTADLLSDLAYDGIMRPVIENNVVINDFPEVRREACSLLGKVGGQSSMDILLHVVATDPEPMVLSEAVYSLGEIGLNPNNQVSEAIAEAVIRQDAVKPDNNFAFASLLAFEKLAKKSNGLEDPNAFRAILLISNGSYIPIVRQKAVQVLSELKNYN